jgi:excinuclease UvrABC nuclease subunit
LIYVGKSYNIKNRIQSSLTERKAFYCKVLKVGNEADANILEPYLISLLNPPLNGDLKTLDRSSFRINHGFRFTKLTKIFK